ALAVIDAEVGGIALDIVAAGATDVPDRWVGARQCVLGDDLRCREQLAIFQSLERDGVQRGLKAARTPSGAPGTGRLALAKHGDASGEDRLRGNASCGVATRSRDSEAERLAGHRRDSLSGVVS